jgi:hypothetical protein
MSKVGLDVITINSLTCDDTLRHQQEELWVTVYLQGNIIIAGPEQLKSKKFKKTVIDYIFWAWTCELGFDEVHLLNVWGPHFQKKI